jgi:predicted DNA-binding transcriptional regulator AlpA
MTSKSQQPVRVLSFPKWCEASGFSTRTGHRLLAAGKGPQVTQLSERRIGIREDHHVEWLNSRIR